MRAILIFFLFLTCCDSDTSKYGFNTGDEVIVGDKYPGVVYKAKKAHIKHEYICVTWIDATGGGQYDCIHYKLLRKK